MNLIKLTDVYCGDALYINSNCILSCEQKYHHESETWYTQVGLLYQNAFEFWYVKETIEEIQYQLEGKTTEQKVEQEVDKKLVGRRIRQIRRENGMTLETFGKIFKATKGNVAKWEQGQSLPNNERLKEIAEFAGITVQELLEG